MDFTKYEKLKTEDTPETKLRKSMIESLAKEIEREKQLLEKLLEDKKAQDRLLREAQHKHYVEVREVFKKDLFEDLGITDNTKREILFEKAWDQGHCEGYSGVYNAANEMVDLVL